MKTEQEIRQMVNTCNVYHSCALCPYRPKDISRFIGDRWKGGCPNCDRKLVYAMGKGYGDVSEYKAEIERLKAEVKQVKIDVLTELRNKCHNYYPSIDHYCCSVKAVNLSDINKMIEELKK